jgi:hypothetical protein
MLNKMKKVNYFSILCAVLLMSVMSGCVKYPAYDVPGQLFVNKSSLNMYVGTETKVTVSPTDAKYIWTSDNNAVASVSQTGLVKALGVGSATITVKSGDLEAKIDVLSKEFVPLDSIVVSETSITIAKGIVKQLAAYPVPPDASKVAFTWSSKNPEIAAIDRDGIVTAVSVGKTEIIVSCDSIEKVINVKVIIEPIKFDKAKFQAISLAGDTRNAWDGWSLSYLYDGDLSRGYHTSDEDTWPHCFSLDMGVKGKIERIKAWQRSTDHTNSGNYCYGHGNMKQFELWGSNTASGDWNVWTKLMDCTSIKPSGSPGTVRTPEDEAYAAAGEEYICPNFDDAPAVRYIRVKAVDTWAGTRFIHLMELEVYGVIED